MTTAGPPDTRKMIYGILREAMFPMKAKDISAALLVRYGVHIDKKRLNPILYTELGLKRLVMKDYRWSLPVEKAKPPSPVPVPLPAIPLVQTPPSPPVSKPIPAPVIVASPTNVVSPQTAATPESESENWWAFLRLCAVVFFISLLAWGCKQLQVVEPPPERHSVPYSVNPPEIQYNKPPPSPRGDVSVRGYHRADGTYVRPHYRSHANFDPDDNYSSKGNVNPYTGKRGSQ